MLAATRSQRSVASAVLMLGSGTARARGDMVLVNLGTRALSAWVRSDSWTPAFLDAKDSSADQWIHLGDIPSRASFNCAAFRDRLDPGCELPDVEFTFVALTADPASAASGLAALIPYDASRNYQLVLGTAVVITARRPPTPS
jgi:hypothetical protein